MRASSEEKILTLSNCHQEDISSIDFNCNKNHTILTSSFDQNIKVWDVRKPEFPILIIHDSDNQ
jgi:WD40 repeat protein